MKPKIDFNKNFGQNFIFDLNLLRAIVNDGDVEANTEVLEIGVGAATLTKEIANKAKKVVAYEIDTNLTPVITEKLEGINNAKVIYGDIMKQDMASIESHFESSYVMVANLPYYITTPIIFKFLEDATKLKTMVIMVQKEVAQRLCAKHNTPEYGAITATINSVADTKITRIVKRNMFTPEPNVDSAVVRIDFKQNKYNIKSFENLNKLVRCAFHMRRKTLVNNLKSTFSLSKEKMEQAFNKLSLPITVRGEALSPEQFVLLSNELF